MSSLPIDYKKAESLESQVEKAFQVLFSTIPFIDEVNNDRLGIMGSFDLVLQVTINGQKWILVIDTAPTGQPRLARNKIERWKIWNSLNPMDNAYFVFAAPYISEASRSICNGSGVGYLDLAGNCFLSFDHVFVERTGYAREAEKRELRSVFHEKGSRVVRRLLVNPSRKWHVHELAKEAEVSTGLVSQVKTKLMDSDLLERKGETFSVSRAKELLKKWADAYRFSKNEEIQFFTHKPLLEVEELLAEHCNTKKIPYAFTVFSGARLIGAQYVRVVGRSYAYVLGDVHKIADQLDMKPVDSGGNVVLLKPFDEDLLFGKRLVGSSWVVSDIQLYLDFSAQKGRAQETADFLIDARIKQDWEKQINADGK